MENPSSDRTTRMCIPLSHVYGSFITNRMPHTALQAALKCSAREVLRGPRRMARVTDTGRSEELPQGVPQAAREDRDEGYRDGRTYRSSTVGSEFVREGRVRGGGRGESGPARDAETWGDCEEVACAACIGEIGQLLHLILTPTVGYFEVESVTSC